MTSINDGWGYTKKQKAAGAGRRPGKKKRRKKNKKRRHLKRLAAVKQVARPYKPPPPVMRQRLTQFTCEDCDEKDIPAAYGVRWVDGRVCVSCDEARRDLAVLHRKTAWEAGRC